MELPVNHEAIQKAVDFAAKHHSGQFRKMVPLPYLFHPLQVLQRIANWGISNEKHPDCWVSTILHDVLEDCEGVTVELLEQEFGKKVADTVHALSYFKDQGTKEDYINKIAGGELEVLVIKVADRICNIYDFYGTDSEYAVKYYNKGKVLFVALKNRHLEIAYTYYNPVLNKMLNSIKKLETTLSFKINETPGP